MGSKSGLTINNNLFYNCEGPLNISRKELLNKLSEAETAFNIITKGESQLLYDGNNLMTGWLSLPEIYLNEKKYFIKEIKNAAKKLQKNIDTFISIGIGGSYLGIEACIEAILPYNYNLINKKKNPKIFFLGNHMSGDEFASILKIIKKGKIGINVISKSGTTLETAVAFRIIRNLFKKKLKNPQKKIILTTNKHKGILKDLIDNKGYNEYFFSKKGIKEFCVPDNIGGRYSVTSPVGLFGISMADIDIKNFLKGALDMQNKINKQKKEKNPAFVRASLRTIAQEKGALIENVVTNTKSLNGLARWARQLWPESEGKNGKGMWISTGFYSEDAHSVGQIVSGGKRNIIETYISVQKSKVDIKIPNDKNFDDGLDYLNGKSLSFINNCANKGLQYDHYKRGVPIFEYIMPEINAYNLGQFFQCEMNACLIACVMQNINGVVQPDVEGYKKAMYALSGKKEYENLKKEIENFFN